MATDHDVHDLNLLAAHLEGRLTEQESASLMAHLGDCEPCRSALAAYARATVVTSVPASGTRLSPAWLPIAAMLALATTVAVVSLRLGPPAAPPATATGAVPRAAPVSVPATGPDTPPPAPSASAPVSERPSQTRAGTRRVAGKRFTLEAGVWIDAAYAPLALLPIDDAATPGARAALLARLPALAPYASLGDNVIVVYAGAVYRIGPLSVARR